MHVYVCNDVVGVGLSLFFFNPSLTHPLLLIWSLACGLADTLQHHCLTERRVSCSEYEITLLRSLYSQLQETIGVSTLANERVFLKSQGVTDKEMYSHEKKKVHPFSASSEHSSSSSNNSNQ